MQPAYLLTRKSWLVVNEPQARYEYTHAILEKSREEAEGAGSFKGQKVDRGRRLSLIFRDVHPNDQQQQPGSSSPYAQ